MGVLSPPVLVVTYTASVIVPLCFLTAIYRLLLHPLRGYPGPLLAKVTDAYAGYSAFHKRLHLDTYQNFQKYGPVIRQAPDRLVFNTITALHDIYLNPVVTKGDSYRRTQIAAKYPSILNTIDKTQHRRKRKIIGQVLTERSIRTFEPLMSSKLDDFLRHILACSQSNTRVDMSQLCQRLALDVIGHLAFGYSFTTQTKETFRFLPSAINDISWRISMYMQLPPLARFEKMFALLGIKNALKFKHMIQGMIKTRMAEPKDAHHDFYSIVADYVGKGQQGLYQEELWPEALFFIIAGGTTSAATMSALFFYLSRNPEAYETLATEIRTTFGSSEEICAGSKLHGCKYLRACIDETLRISPPSPAILWRQQDAGSDAPFFVDGHFIPPGTQVGISMYALMHNEEYFPDSFTFKPERWLEPAAGSAEDTPERKAALETMRKAFVPFSLGDRGCAGKSMAYLEISAVVARCLWYFDFAAAPGEAGQLGAGKPGMGQGRDRVGEYQLGDIFVSEHQGPNLVFHKRGELWRDLQTVT